MTKQTARVISGVLSLAGILLLLAMAFEILPESYALFGGVAFFVVAGSIWGFVNKP